MWRAEFGSLVTSSPSLAPEQKRDPIAHLGPPEIWGTVGRFRFVPSSYLEACDLDSDSGVAHLLYLRSLISDEIEEA
jgi:hypothetical protein